MTVPSRVRVGSVRYAIITDPVEIKRFSDENAPPGGEWEAFSDHQQMVIGVNAEHSVENQRVSLLHEILHCCLRYAGVHPNVYAQVVAEARDEDRGIPVEEFTVAAQSGPLLGVLRDNPDLLAWLTEDSP